MSMPLPIHVALIGKSIEEVSRVMKSFRLSAPGIGAAFYSALDAPEGGKVLPLKKLSRGRIALWICLDEEAWSVAKEFHEEDLRHHRYCRGFYDEDFPEACVLIQDGTSKEQRRQLAKWADSIIQAWQNTS